MSSSQWPAGDVREPIVRTVIRQAWANVDNFGTLVWLVVGVVAIVSANVADAIDAEGSHATRVQYRISGRVVRCSCGVSLHTMRVTLDRPAS